VASVPGGGACKDVVTERGGRAGEAVVGEERHHLVQPRRRHAPRRRAVGGWLLWVSVFSLKRLARGAVM
jgi:hypothetical protein